MPRTTLLLTDEIERTVVETLRAVGRDKPAAARAGISLRTYYAWLERGRARRKLYEDGDLADTTPEIRRLYHETHHLWTNGQKQHALAYLALIDQATEDRNADRCLRFLQAVEEAKASLHLELGALVLRGARQDPKLALAYLRATFPDEYDPQPYRVEVTGVQGGPVTVREVPSLPMDAAAAREFVDVLVRAGIVSEQDASDAFAQG